MRTKEYKPIPVLNQWLLQRPLNPNITVNPDAVVGVGRRNIPSSCRKSTDGHRESEIDLTKILKEQRDIILKLQAIEKESGKGSKPTPSSTNTEPRYSSRKSVLNENWL